MLVLQHTKRFVIPLISVNEHLDIKDVIQEYWAPFQGSRHGSIAARSRCMSTSQTLKFDVDIGYLMNYFAKVPLGKK